jgi:hypothetical protein
VSDAYQEVFPIHGRQCVIIQYEGMARRQAGAVALAHVLLLEGFNFFETHPTQVLSPIRQFVAAGVMGYAVC